MAQVSYPGVYIVEKASGVRTITGVATSIAAFVGYTRKGEPDKAVPITSYADFERGFGGLDRDSPVSYAVRQFFLNGGTQALIVRVVAGKKLTSWLLKGDGAADVLKVTAASPGEWANTLRITVERDSPQLRNPHADFNLIVSQLQPDSSTVTLETHRNLSMDPKSPQFVESVVKNASALVQVERVAGLVFAQTGCAVSDKIDLAHPPSPSNTVIGGTLDDTTPFLLIPVPIPVPWTDINTLVHSINDAISDAGLASVLLALETGEDGGAGNGHLSLKSLTVGESSSVVITRGAFGGLTAAIKLGLENGGRELPAAIEHRPIAAINVAPSTLGAGDKGGPNDLIGSPDKKSGIYSLLDVDLFNLLCIPETFDMPAGKEAAVIPAATKLCEDRRAFYIVDAPLRLKLTEIGAWTNAASQSRNAATYFPPVRVLDPLDGLRPRSMAPSGTLAGVYARTDATRGVWKAPAGTDATLNGVLDLALPVNDLENGQINPLGVNVLRSFPAYGRVCWGARTMKGADAQADEYKYIPIRRLALFIEESLYRGTQWVVFEPNDEPLWAQIRLNLGAFMNGLFRQGAFQGKTQQEAFFVKCDKETTTQADRNLGIVNIQVGFAPLKPAEFVVITIQQIAGDLQ
ncbi:phage tail sheath family protein [Pseudomonas akapageensis]|uniref:phage tail sheath family protein n=1 Tax=Pseudomonas akapageensis TaxID=2609961 RepID=UPI0014084373|nr:phage tail sheath C-terminal domain-containing protein [Pseudomonas akapageensis]